MKKLFCAAILALLFLFPAFAPAQHIWEPMNPNTTTQKYSTLLFLINNFYMDTKM